MGGEDGNSSAISVVVESDNVLPERRAVELSALREIELTRLQDLPLPVLLRVSTILSVGVVLSFLLFETLCFAYPDAANQWIPAVLSALVPLLVKLFVDADRKKQERNK